MQVGRRTYRHLTLPLNSTQLAANLLCLGDAHHLIRQWCGLVSAAYTEES